VFGAQLENQEARAAEAQEQALAAIAKASSSGVPNSDSESLQAKIVEQVCWFWGPLCLRPISFHFLRVVLKVGC
jgi:hypothetical protein